LDRNGSTEGDEMASTKITAIYENPVDPEAFEAGYPEQLARARKIPGVRRTESAKVWPKEDGSPTPAYRLLDLYFDDYDAASAAVTTQEAGDFFPLAVSQASGGVRFVFAHLEDE
jgi:uncharacterized protein (TIGR02118 family)